MVRKNIFLSLSLSAILLGNLVVNGQTDVENMEMTDLEHPQYINLVFDLEKKNSDDWAAVAEILYQMMDTIKANNERSVFIDKIKSHLQALNAVVNKSTVGTITISTRSMNEFTPDMNSEMPEFSMDDIMNSSHIKVMCRIECCKRNDCWNSITAQAQSIMEISENQENKDEVIAGYLEDIAAFICTSEDIKGSLSIVIDETALPAE